MRSIWVNVRPKINMYLTIIPQNKRNSPVMASVGYGQIQYSFSPGAVEINLFEIIPPRRVPPGIRDILIGKYLEKNRIVHP